MPSSSTTPGYPSACDDALEHVAFRYTDSVGTRDQFSIAAQWLACTIASRAALAGIHRLIADFTVEDLAKFQANDLKPRWDGLDAKIKGLVFWLRKSGSPRQSASRTCK
jgi:hypothetical protein